MSVKASWGNAVSGERRMAERYFPGLKYNLKYAALGGKRVFRHYASGRKRVLNCKYKYTS